MGVNTTPPPMYLESTEFFRGCQNVLQSSGDISERKVWSRWRTLVRSDQWGNGIKQRWCVSAGFPGHICVVDFLGLFLACSCSANLRSLLYWWTVTRKNTSGLIDILTYSGGWNSSVTSWLLEKASVCQCSEHCCLVLCVQQHHGKLRSICSLLCGLISVKIAEDGRCRLLKLQEILSHVVSTQQNFWTSLSVHTSQP